MATIRAGSTENGTWEDCQVVPMTGCILAEALRISFYGYVHLLSLLSAPLSAQVTLAQSLL